MKTAKVLTCLIVLIFDSVSAFVVSSLQLLALNGFDNRSGGTALQISLVLQLIFIIITTVISYFIFGYFQNNRRFSSVLASLITILISLVIGIIFSVIIFFGGIALAMLIWETNKK